MPNGPCIPELPTSEIAVMSAEFNTTSPQLPETWLDSFIEEFERAWQRGARPEIAPFLARVGQGERARLPAGISEK
jgi:hypothetical protein